MLYFPILNPPLSLSDMHVITPKFPSSYNLLYIRRLQEVIELYTAHPGSDFIMYILPSKISLAYDWKNAIVEVGTKLHIRSNI